MDGQFFSCRCIDRQDGKDSIKMSAVDLSKVFLRKSNELDTDSIDQIVNNWDGDLTCYANRGERHDRCPDEESFDPTKDAAPGWGGF